MSIQASGWLICINGATVYQIYEDIARAAAERGWDNVDLVIIGGDFQVSISSFGEYIQAN
ncbi:lariat debranching enzyme [Penicillium citrinum]|uniref:Lariat debranching enzyme n=1 Tax=Penicillium citrinum TaxID=5077 RepID=A0A9W9PCU9_PENCI|nr:lariat debranching enzyme [Penicillium citrinum]KAJ5241661.1 lariat debranching enzyme [Penicillium citrinum]